MRVQQRAAPRTVGPGQHKLAQAEVLGAWPSSGSATPLLRRSNLDAWSLMALKARDRDSAMACAARAGLPSSAAFDLNRRDGQLSREDEFFCQIRSFFEREVGGEVSRMQMQLLTRRLPAAAVLAPAGAVVIVGFQETMRRTELVGLRSRRCSCTTLTRALGLDLLCRDCAVAGRAERPRGGQAGRQGCARCQIAQAAAKQAAGDARMRASCEKNPSLPGCPYSPRSPSRPRPSTPTPRAHLLRHDLGEDKQGP